jgi:hypothetical protein
MNPQPSTSKMPLTKPNEQSYLEQYIKSLNEKELKAYQIAMDHLGMSFQIEKSIGYLAWKTDNKLR